VDRGRKGGERDVGTRVSDLNGPREKGRTTGGTGGVADAEAARAWPRPRRMMARAATAAPSAKGATFTMFTIVACDARTRNVELPNITVVTSRGAPTSRDGDDDGLEAESQDRRSECRRCREHGYIERRVDQEGHEAEDSPDAPWAVRARGEASLEVQGVQRLSARSSAPSMQGVRRCINLRARSSAPRLQGVRWVISVRARSSAPSMQGVRWGINMRARSSAHSVQGVRRVWNLRARSSAL
jgi:hypothetical protein